MEIKDKTVWLYAQYLEIIDFTILNHTESFLSGHNCKLFCAIIHLYPNLYRILMMERPNYQARYSSEPPSPNTYLDNTVDTMM